MEREYIKTSFIVTEQGAPIVNSAVIVEAIAGMVAIQIDLRSKYCEVGQNYDENGECGIYIYANENSVSLNEKFSIHNPTIITFPDYKNWKVFIAGNAGKYTMRLCLLREPEERVDPVTALRNFMNSDKGKEAIKKMEEKRVFNEKRLKARAKIVENYLKTHSFKETLERCLKEIELSEQRAEKANNRVRSNNKIMHLFRYACKHGTKARHVKGITNIGFTNECYKYEGYYFRTMWGQGVALNIFNEKKENIFHD